MKSWLRLTEAPARDVLRAWWNSLEDDRGGRAELRRCERPESVVFIETFHRLLHALRARDYMVDAARLASVAGLVAGVRAHVPHQDGMAAQLGKPGTEATRAPVSALRFRRLLEAQDPEETYTILRRFVAQLKGCCDLSSLAHAAYCWSHDDDQTLRRRWALAYYAHAPSTKKESR